jgi:hypothetical protein
MKNPLDSVERAAQGAPELKAGDGAIDIGGDSANSDSASVQSRY